MSTTNRRRRFMPLVAQCLALVLLGACAETTPPTASESGAPRFAEVRFPSEVRPRGIEDVYLAIERTVPGFGGLYFDADQDIVAYVTDERWAEAARSAVLGLLEDGTVRPTNSSSSEVEVTVLRGDYSMSELVSWQTTIHASMDEFSGIGLLDADERQNRVRIGVISESETARVRDLVEGWGVPREAVVFDIIPGPPTDLADLTDNYGTVRGGVRIDTGYGDCTYGASVQNLGSSTQYFLTASHCAFSWTGGGYTMYQPVVAAGRQLGTVAVNPAWSTTGCHPLAVRCRNTDAALYFRTHLASDYEVFKTTGVGTGNYWGTTTVASQQATGAVVDGSMGNYVFKTGQITGTTYGPIIGTCVNQGPSTSGSEVFCAHEVELAAYWGDSGAPFWWCCGTLFPATGWYSGILFSGNLNLPQVRTYYSPWSLIRSELGMPSLLPAPNI